MGYFEAILKKNGQGFTVGDSLSYADLYLYFLIENVEADLLSKYPLLSAHKEKIANRPQIAAYLAKRPVTPF